MIFAGAAEVTIWNVIKSVVSRLFRVESASVAPVPETFAVIVPPFFCSPAITCNFAWLAPATSSVTVPLENWRSFA